MPTWGWTGYRGALGKRIERTITFGERLERVLRGLRTLTGSHAEHSLAYVRARWELPEDPPLDLADGCRGWRSVCLVAKEYLEHRQDAKDGIEPVFPASDGLEAASDGSLEPH